MDPNTGVCECFPTNMNLKQHCTISSCIEYLPKAIDNLEE